MAYYGITTPLDVSANNPNANHLGNPGSAQTIAKPTPTNTLAGIQAGITSAQNQANTIQTGVNNLPPASSSPSPTPATTPSSTPTSSSTPTTTADTILQAYLSSLKPTNTELGLQSQLNDLQTQQNNLGINEQQGDLNIDTNPIPLEFQTGQKAALGRQYGIQNQTNAVNQQTIGQKLALEQAKRQSGVDVTKALLEANKPISESYGAQLVNPITGQTINQGLFGAGSTGGTGVNPVTGLSPTATSADILGYLTQNGVQTTRYNMPGLINAVQNGATAQDIISGKVNVASQTSAGTSGSTYKLNPLTGQYEQPNPATASKISSPILGTPSSQTGAYQAGQLTKLLQSQGKTADDATLQGLWKQYGTGGTYANDMAHNSAIYNAMQGNSTSTSQSDPNNLPSPTTYAQKDFNKDFTSGGLSDKINAQNTAIGHLTAAFDLAKQMENWSLQPANKGKNFLATELGKAAVQNYQLAHGMSSAELASAYGQGTGGERDAMSVLGDSNSSPEQLRGFVQTSAQLLSSKILSNIQQYKTAYGQNAQLNLNWFVSPQNVQSLASVGIIIKKVGNEVGAYKVGADGSATKLN